MHMRSFCFFSFPDQHEDALDWGGQTLFARFEDAKLERFECWVRCCIQSEA